MQNLAAEILICVLTLPSLCLARQLDLKTIVEGALWPPSEAEFKQALQAAESARFSSMTRVQFHDLEEILRRGPTKFLREKELSSGRDLLQEFMVDTPEGKIPVLVQLPPSYREERPWPLMFAMHGGPTTSPRQARSAAARMLRVWRRPAGRAGWIVAAPAMTTTSSVDRYQPDRLPYDVFHPEQASAVIDELRRRYRVDPDRIVATGISLGSNFSIAYAAAHPDWFASIVPVSTEGDYREPLLRNLQSVPVYILEGSRDQNIRTINGPRALQSILTHLGYDLTFREFNDRAHEGFQEHYDDVLLWLDRRPRQNYPTTVLRVPHSGIMPLSRRVYWIESDTRQGIIRARVAGHNRIEIEAWHAAKVRILLHDRLVDLDRKVEIRVNGVRAFSGTVERSLKTALEEVRKGDEKRIWAAAVEVEIPRTSPANDRGKNLSLELKPQLLKGRLSFWEMYATRALQERFPHLGFGGEEVEVPPTPAPPLPEQVAIRVIGVEESGPAATAGLHSGDLLLAVGGEPFFAGGALKTLYSWLLRELRAEPAVYPLEVWRGGKIVTLQARFKLGPYLHRSSPTAGPERPLISFDHYHRVGEFETYLEQTAMRYPKLTRLREIGRSRAGRRILALEINNPETGAASEKPGFYLDGNIHGGEVLGGEGALYFIQHLLTRYGKDETIKSLVDSSAFYVVPLVNPDGRAISVDTPENHRWNSRPVDEDRDGKSDEDPPEDLDGDGRILRMRVPDPGGPWKVSPQDARIMIRRRSGDQGGEYYRVYREGMDNDGDGRYNEDGVGGIDINRNFPANWHPAQYASGPYPLSEPESRALTEYITSHPNIAAIHTYHTSGGLLLRFPTLAGQDWDYPQSDLEDYKAIADDGVPLTGYENYAYEKQKIVDLMQPGHGVFNDWGSKVFGVLAMTTEMWKHPMDQSGLLEWNKEVLGGKGFIDWHPFDHPQLGRVELGGWDRWSIASPPEGMIEAELKRNNDWVLTFAQKLPRVELLDLRVEPPPGQSGSLKIQARIANRGWMPTATRYALDVLKIARPVRVELKLENARVIKAPAEVRFAVLPGSREDGPVPKTLSWQVEIVDTSQPSYAEIVVRSEKAGTVRRHTQLRD